MNKILLGMIGSAAVAGLGWVMWPEEAQGGLLPYDDATITAQGQSIYIDYCAACHGAELQGEADWRSPDADGYLPAPPHDPSGHTWHHPDALLIEITRAGTEAVVANNYRSRMIRFGDILSEADIIAVLAYIKSTWPQQVIDVHNRINADAAMVD